MERTHTTNPAGEEPLKTTYIRAASMKSLFATLVETSTTQRTKHQQTPDKSATKGHERPLGALTPAIGLFFPRATFFGQARVPHVVQTGENSQKTDKQTEHLQRKGTHNKTGEGISAAEGGAGWLNA